MDANLGDALSGLLFLSSDSNNDSDHGSMTHITNDSDVTPTSNNSSSSLTQANCLVKFGVARQVRLR
jgi:hypothetical protein